jgi:hypothetical protein
MGRDLRPLRSESHFAKLRAEAKDERERAAVEFNALRARMKDAPAHEWERLANLLAGLGH